MMKNAVMLFGVLIVVIFLFTPETGAKKKVVTVGDPMPGFFLKDIDGKDFFLDNYVGKKAKDTYTCMIFSLSASYCKPCKKEIPELEKLLKKYKDKGLGIYIIALEKEEQARKLVAETKTILPVLVDRYNIVPKLLGNKGIPFTLLVDREGTVRLINSGFSEKKAKEMVERLEHEIMAILGAGSGDSAE